MSLQALDSFVADRISEHRGYTPEGYLIALSIPIARTGVQTYKAEEIDKDGTLGVTGLVDVYRSAEEVFKPASILSFEGKSIVSPHPPQFLNKDNDSLYSKGHVQNVRMGDRLPDGERALIADLVFKDAALISMIEDGHRLEISGGYTYDLRPEENEHSANAKFVQRNICGNHVAVVPNARGGSSLRVLDSKPEEGATMAEELKITEKPAGMWSEFTTFLKTAGLRLVASDEDPGAVERNKRKDEEAMTKKIRVDDAESKEVEKEEKGAKEPEGEDKKAKDSEEREEKKEKSSANDARLDRICDALEKLVARDSKAEDKCSCDAEEGEEHSKGCPMFKKKESEDADLIPIHKLHGDEIPKNPIPGADAALEKLRVLKPTIAKSGDKQAIDAYNEAILQLKEGADSGEGSYADFTRLKKPEKVENAEARHHVGDSKFNRAGPEAGSDFEAAAAKFHRMNPTEVKRQ